MLAFCEHLSRTPPETGPAEIDALRAQGFDDRAILDICQIAAYFAFVNRLAEGLGVELEEEP
jgi:alkylhydroperoxidase family enzyme